ncbi:MAG: site-specific integrase [Oscillospiraceae bacterium]|nr:site-specific integrase [Oscillospiraceae bacterium]MBQ8996384.1 site-specific integrase [Oscillospiraceae bacterium]
MYKDNRGLWREYIVVNGKRKYFSAKNKKELLLKIAKYDIAKKEELKFSFVAEAWREENWDRLMFGSLRTYDPCYRRAVEEFGEMDLEEITPKLVQLWLRSLAEKYSAKTVGNHKSIVSQIFDFASLELNRDIANPCDRVKLPRCREKGTREPISDRDRQVILSINKDGFQLPFLLFFTGLRCGEALALQMKDVDFEHDLIHVTKAVVHVHNQPTISTPKTRKSVRAIPLLPQLKTRLLELNLSPDDYIVGGSRPLTESMLKKRWDKWCRENDVKFDRHSLRHTFASVLFEAGIPPKSAQEILGHAQLSTTMDIYTHISEEKQKKEFAALSSYFEKMA